MTMEGRGKEEAEESGLSGEIERGGKKQRKAEEKIKQR